MSEVLSFLLDMVTVLFGGYIALFLFNRIHFSIDYNKSNSKEVKGRKMNDMQEDNDFQLRKNKM